MVLSTQTMQFEKDARRSIVSSGPNFSGVLARIRRFASTRRMPAAIFGECSGWGGNVFGLVWVWVWVGWAGVRVCVCVSGVGVAGWLP